MRMGTNEDGNLAIFKLIYNQLVLTSKTLVCIAECLESSGRARLSDAISVLEESDSGNSYFLTTKDVMDEPSDVLGKRGRNKPSTPGMYLTLFSLSFDKTFIFECRLIAGIHRAIAHCLKCAAAHFFTFLLPHAPFRHKQSGVCS
jgi:hypothetical protein